jgi:hypothetical protein
MSDDIQFLADSQFDQHFANYYQLRIIHPFPPHQKKYLWIQMNHRQTGAHNFVIGRDNVGRLIKHLAHWMMTGSFDAESICERAGVPQR